MAAAFPFFGESLLQKNLRYKTLQLQGSTSAEDFPHHTCLKRGLMGSWWGPSVPPCERTRTPSKLPVYHICPNPQRSYTHNNVCHLGVSNKCLENTWELEERTDGKRERKGGKRKEGENRVRERLPSEHVTLIKDLK